MAQNLKHENLSKSGNDVDEGEKSNKCNQCDYASSWAGALRTHLKLHSGEKSNKCNQCDFASSYTSALRTHLKTHSNLKKLKIHSGVHLPLSLLPPPNLSHLPPLI